MKLARVRAKPGQWGRQRRQCATPLTARDDDGDATDEMFSNRVTYRIVGTRWAIRYALGEAEASTRFIRRSVATAVDAGCDPRTRCKAHTHPRGRAVWAGWAARRAALLDARTAV